jgi:hydroxymethylbilane synthase
VNQTIRIGTRGSDLALWQANHIAERLRSVHPGIETEIVIIKTTGDRIRDRPLAEIGGKGLFTKEIEEALLEGAIDLAVHSLKDMPVEAPEGLALDCFPGRAEPFDVLCPRDPAVRSLADLSEGAVVGTGSARRQLQILRARPDVRVVGLRGNVPTRLGRRFAPEPGLDAVVLAEAGVRRLGLWEENFVRLAPPEVIPAPSQGTLAIETRANDASVFELIRALDDRVARISAAAERACLARIEGDCHTPFAAWASLSGENMTVTARLFDDAGNAADAEATAVVGGEQDAAALGRRVAEQLLR